MKKLLIGVFVFCFSGIIFAQNNLLNELEKGSNTEEKSNVTSIFKGYKLINFETPKLVPKKHLNFIVAHRFGSIKNGIEDLYGLDIASTRLQFVYGLTDKVNISFSRSKFQRTYSFGLKYHIKSQEKGGFPLAIVGHHTLGINTLYTTDLFPNLEFSNRLRSSHQLILASKINNKISIEFVPTILHDGVVSQDNQDNLQYALGFGGRYLLTKRMGIITDYGLHLNRANNSPYNNVFSLGFEMETGGHVFQLSFSNAQGMFENAFITEAIGDWSEGDIFFGFNINRIFDFKKKR